MEWHNLYRGFLIGTSDLIPGVSGGTIAVMLGIYDRLLDAISGVFSREWRRHVNFLLPLGIGMAAALLSLSRTIAWLLEHQYVPTQFFFIGLIIGILPSLLQQVDIRNRFRFAHFATLLTAAALVASMAYFTPDRTSQAIIELTPLSAVGLFAAGWLASMAMLLPGISGSFVLLMLGVYPTAIDALATLNIALIAIIGLGVALGFIVSSKIIRHLLSRYHDIAYAAIIGLIVGSLFVVYPSGIGGASVLVSGLTLLIGLALALFFGQRTG